MNRFITAAFLSTALLTAVSAQAQTSVVKANAEIKQLAETPSQRDARMNWFREARFGMFIHWGLYAVPAGEYNGNKNYGEWFLEETHMPVSQYEKYADNFNPTQFDAKAWVKMAKDAGMKYIVITSKHHDGFDMFRSQTGDWGIKRTAFQRDPLKELAAACKEAGLKMCFYHSIMDWHHPEYTPRRAWNDVAAAKEPTPDMDEYVKYLKAQLKELLTNYGPIGILWFDGEWEESWTHERGVDLYNYVRTLQPNIIVNNRVGKSRSGMQGMNKGEGVGDYGTPEQEIPATGFGAGVDWESCMTMNNHWGYNKADDNWKSTQTLVRNLIDCASKGGNYLLNVGPTAQGLIPNPSIERLQQIGSWMKTNHSAIYDTSASPFKRLNWGRATTQREGKNTKLFLHVWDWPADGELMVPGLKNKITRAYLLDTKKRLNALHGTNGVSISLPKIAPNAISSTIVLDIAGTPIVEETPLTQNADGTLQLSPIDATLHGALNIERKADSKDNFGFWLDKNDFVEWNFQATRAGKYVVTSEVAAPDTTSLNMMLGGKTVRAEIPKTGDYTIFQPVTLGTIEIAAPGRMTLQLKPGENWNAINLRALKIQPAQ